MSPSTPDDRCVVLPHTRCERLEGLDQAAILFAAGQDSAARAILEAACAADLVPAPAWTMLFDLHRALGDRPAFEACLVRYQARNPKAAIPAWSTPSLVATPGMVRLTGSLDSKSALEPFATMGATRRIVAVDLGELTRVGFELVPEFCALLRMLVHQSRRVILANVAELHGRLLAIAGLPHDVAVLPRRAGGSRDAAAPMDRAAVETPRELMAA